jgi:uncharacterized protein YjlB
MEFRAQIFTQCKKFRKFLKHFKRNKIPNYQKIPVIMSHFSSAVANTLDAALDRVMGAKDGDGSFRDAISDLATSPLHAAGHIVSGALQAAAFVTAGTLGAFSNLSKGNIGGALGSLAVGVGGAVASVFGGIAA